jgi:hypothetical protein
VFWTEVYLLLLFELMFMTIYCFSVSRRYSCRCGVDIVDAEALQKTQFPMAAEE